MKHILSLLTVALLGAAAPVFADPAFTDPVFNGYTVKETPYNNEFYQGMGEGSYYTIRFNGSGTFYLAGIRNSHYGDIQTEYLTNTYIGTEEDGITPKYGAPTYGITHYGYIDSKGNVHKFDLFKEDGITPSDNVVNFTSKAFDGRIVTREGYRLGYFNAGDEIQVYLDGTFNDQPVWTATNSPQTGIYSSRFGGRPDTDKSNPEMAIGQLYFGDQYSSQMNFGIVASGQTYTPGTSGAPLPGGVSIALVAGLFGLGLWYVRRRKAVAV